MSMITTKKMTKSIKTRSLLALLTIAVVVSVFGLARPAFASESAQAVVSAVEEPTTTILEDGTTVYSQKALVKIESGNFRGTEEETTYVFPSPGMKRPLKVGDKLVVEIDPENISQRIRISDFERKSYLAIIPIVSLLVAALVYATNKSDWAYILAVLLYPIVSFLGYHYGKMPAIVAVSVPAVLLGTTVIAIKYSKLIPIITAIISFIVSYVIGGLVVYGLFRTLNLAAGAADPFVAFYRTSYPSNLESLNLASMLILPFAAILSIVISVVSTVIKARAQEDITSKSELVKIGILEGLAASKDSVFSFYTVAMGFILPVILAVSQSTDLGTVVNNELFSYFIVMAVSPIITRMLSVSSTSIAAGIALGSATPYRLVTDREIGSIITKPGEEESNKTEPTQGPNTPDDKEPCQVEHSKGEETKIVVTKKEGEPTSL